MTTNAFGELTHYLPLRNGFNVTITLPRDLTAEEAKRIAIWLAAMAIETPWKPDPAADAKPKAY